MKHQTSFGLTGVKSMGEFCWRQERLQAIHATPNKTRKNSH
jgi:hypothetical protein